MDDDFDCEWNENWMKCKACTKINCLKRRRMLVSRLSYRVFVHCLFINLSSTTRDNPTRKSSTREIRCYFEELLAHMACKCRTKKLILMMNQVIMRKYGVLIYRFQFHKNALTTLDEIYAIPFNLIIPGMIERIKQMKSLPFK
jgi:hypothetical protein